MLVVMYHLRFLGATSVKDSWMGVSCRVLKAILSDPENADAKYNLELALKELRKAKEQQEQDSGKGSQKDSEQGGKGKQPDAGEKEEASKESPQEGSSDQKESAGQDQRDQQGKAESGQESATRQDEGRKAEQDPPKDLSGDLQALQALSEAEDDSYVSDRAISSTDRKKAEALLDNIKENRQRFLKSQVPEDKQRGVASGKAW